MIKKDDPKYRYFFEIENVGVSPFNGTVEIQMINGYGKYLLKDIFLTNQTLEPGIKSIHFIEANTGPESMNGDFGYVKFEYKINVNGKVIKSGEADLLDYVVEEKF